MSGTMVRVFATSRLASARVVISGSVWKRNVSNVHMKATERTLKTRRILSRFNFQVAIASSSSFLWKRREIAPRLFRLMMFPWISATVLRIKTL